MLTFEQLWSLLHEHGATNYYKHDCCEIWNNLTPDRQKQLYDTISTKLRQGLFVHYNPLQAINANIRRQQPIGHPTNYNGARSLPDEPLVRAIKTQNGHFPRGFILLLPYFYRTFALIRSRVNATTNGHARSCDCTAKGSQNAKFLTS